LLVCAGSAFCGGSLFHGRMALHAARRVCAVAIGTRATGAALAYTRKDSGNVTGDALEAQVEVEYFPWEYFGFS
jgi:hypothetical protein